MNKLYCSNVNCAKPNLYEAAKPKFCSHCGQPFSSGFAPVVQPAPSKPVVAQQTTQTAQAATVSPTGKNVRVIYIEEPELDFSNLKIGVKESSQQKLTLGQLQSNASMVPNADRPVGNQTDQEQVLRENIRRAKYVNRDVEGE